MTEATMRTPTIAGRLADILSGDPKVKQAVDDFLIGLQQAKELSAGLEFAQGVHFPDTLATGQGAIVSNAPAPTQQVLQAAQGQGGRFIS